MEIRATLTAREVVTMKERLRTICRLSSDRKVREQCRMILSAIGKAERRAKRKPGTDKPGPAIEIVYNPFTEELIFND